MAKPPSLRSISRESIGDIPDWAERLLKPLNVFMGEVADGLWRGLSVSENLAQEWVDVTIQEGAALPGPLALRGLRGREPRGISIERVRLLSGSTPSGGLALDWEPTSLVDANGQRVPAMVIRGLYGLYTGSRVALTLLVKAE